MSLRLIALSALLSLASTALAQQPTPGLGPAPEQQQDPQVQRAQQLQIEIMQIDQQLQPSQQKALEAPEVKSKETEIREALMAEIQKIVPDAKKHESRLEALQAEMQAKSDDPEAQQALLNEGRQIAEKLQGAQQQALALPDMKERIDAFETLLIAEMKKADPKAKELLDKRENDDEYSFMTEILGESWDVGSKLVTLSDLRAACVLPWDNVASSAAQGYNKRGHLFRVLAVDWSGGGSKEESLTALAVLGVLNTGRIEVMWMKKYPHSADYYADAMRVIQAYKQFGCALLAHDFGGAGDGREQILVHAGFPLEKIVPITLVRAHAQKAMLYYNEPKEEHVRHSYSLDKARSIVYTCELIKSGYILFPKFISSESCIRDFLALVEETIQTPRGSDIFLIGKSQGVPDDVAQSVNLGVAAIYHRLQKWPNIAGMRSITHALSALKEADPGMIDPQTIMHSKTKLIDLD